MLATDLDGTFIGDEQAMHTLWRDLDDAGVLVVFATGRHLSSIEKFYAEFHTTRRADSCVAMVGTEIWHRRKDGYALDESWRTLLSESWDRSEVTAIVSEVPNVELQPKEWQSPLKASYYLESAPESQITEIHGRLATRGIDAKIVYSAGRFLDLLPPGSGKGEAVKYLAAALNVALEDVVTAGDTGNDLDMMRLELGLRSIVVGNASPDLLARAPAESYRADAAFAAGIREGLEHYGWFEPVASR
jgi:mannosylfructose-6-phosphate phosphatase